MYTVISQLSVVREICLDGCRLLPTGIVVEVMKLCGNKYLSIEQLTLSNKIIRQVTTRTEKIKP